MMKKLGLRKRNIPPSNRDGHFAFSYLFLVAAIVDLPPYVYGSTPQRADVDKEMNWCAH